MTLHQGVRFRAPSDPDIAAYRVVIIAAGIIKDFLDDADLHSPLGPAYRDILFNDEPFNALDGVFDVQVFAINEEGVLSMDAIAVVSLSSRPPDPVEELAPIESC